jgi:hypothetical protein
MVAGSVGRAIMAAQGRNAAHAISQHYRVCSESRKVSPQPKQSDQKVEKFAPALGATIPGPGRIGQSDANAISA